MEGRTYANITMLHTLLLQIDLLEPIDLKNYFPILER